MDKIDFREITIANLDQIEALRVKPEQLDLVAENIYSIAQSGLDPQGWCRAVYLGETPVAFFYIRNLNEGKLSYICRFMVDQNWQGRGIGRNIMSELIPQLFSYPSVETIEWWISNGIRALDFRKTVIPNNPINRVWSGALREINNLSEDRLGSRLVCQLYLHHGR